MKSKINFSQNFVKRLYKRSGNLRFDAFTFRIWICWRTALEKSHFNLTGEGKTRVMDHKH